MMGPTTPLCLCTFMIWVNAPRRAALWDLCVHAVCVSVCVYTINSTYSVSVCMYVFSQGLYLSHPHTHTHPRPLSHTHSCSAEACDLRWMVMTGCYLRACKSAQLYIRRKSERHRGSDSFK